MARGTRSQKLWVRSSISLTVVGTSANTASVNSLRDASATTTASGAAQLGLPNEFTVVRFLAWAQYESLDTAAGLLSNPPAGIVGVRVGGKEEIEEMIADTAFRAESGPVQDPLSDWLLWGPTHAAQGVAANVGTGSTTDVFIGKEMFDIRSARRVDGLSEDIAIMLQVPVASLATTTQSMRLSYAALCIVH